MSHSQAFVDALNTKFSDERFAVEEGLKFDRIVLINSWGSGRSCHAFVEKSTGNLIKSATWRAPQKSVKHPSGLAVRFNLSNKEEFRNAVNAADVFGGYLYDKR